MARKCSYTKRDLVVACSRTKKSIEKDFRVGKIEKNKITKSYIYNELAKRLRLSSSAIFYKKTYMYYDYLDTWHKGLYQHIENITPISTDKSNFIVNSKNNYSSNRNNLDFSKDDSKKIDKLISEIKEKDELIKYLNSVIKELRMENESLRLSRISKIHKLDIDRNSDILDESLDSVEVKHLYSVIKRLHDSIFQE